MNLSKSAPFNVGPYRIGMTNAQAANYGIKDCERKYGRIECNPTFENIEYVRRATIVFSESTKRVTEIYVRVTVFPFNNIQGTYNPNIGNASKWSDADWVRKMDTLAMNFNASMHVLPCDSGMEERSRKLATNLDSCFHANEVREIGKAFNSNYDGGRNGRTDPMAMAWISVKADPKAGKAFRERQSKEQKEKRKLDRLQKFENGL